MFLSRGLLGLAFAFIFPCYIDAKICPKTCVMPKNTTVIGGDDSPGILAAITACGSNSRLLFKKGVTYNIFTPWKFTDITNVEFVFEGNLTLSDNVTEVQSVVGNSRIYPGQWIQVRGENVTFTGSTNPSGGWFIGHGDLWWATDNQVNRPKFFGLYASNMVIRNMKVLKPIAWVFGISGTGVVMTNTLIDARSDSAFPFNTDGIDLSGSNVLIEDITIYNGDDGIVISPPAVNVTVRNAQLHGTHGLSVTCTSGVGGNYIFENADVYDSLIACRFKGKKGTTCNLTDVTWRDIRVHNVSYPIHFIENYWDPENKTPPPDTGLAAYASNWTWERISGTIAPAIGDGSCVSDPCWYYTEGQSPQKGIYLLCQDAAHCQGFHFSDIDIRTAHGVKSQEECTGLNGVMGMGITCTNGTITPD